MTLNDEYEKYKICYGFRGFFVFLVIFFPNALFKNSEGLIFTYSMTFFCATNVYFVLNSFTLSYRLINKLNNQNLKTQLLIVIKYFIRRLFRVYFVFLFFVTISKFGPNIIRNPYKYKEIEWLDIVTLGQSGENQLWTFAVQIKYYFFIPFFLFDVF